MSGIEELEQRRIDNIGKQVDNASLQAGAPMYYYCHACGAPAAVLPEGWWETPPPKYCELCKPLIEADLITDNYDHWLRARGEKTVPR
jgi:hypothetical protein